MSHTVKVRMIADQIISIAGREINIHDLETIYVSDDGIITDFVVAKQTEEADRLPAHRN